MFLGVMIGAVPVAEKPLSGMMRGTIGTAVPAAVKPAKAISRVPGPEETGDVLGACLGPASLAGDDVGTVAVIAPGGAAETRKLVGQLV